MMRPNYLGVLALVGLLFPSLIVAEVQPVNTIIQKALIQHPNIISAQATREELLKAVDGSQVGPNPEIEMGLGRKNDGNSNGLTSETTLKQTFLYPGKIDSKKALALTEVDLQDMTLQKLKSQLANDILITLFEQEFLQQKYDINQKRIEKLNWMKEYLASRPFISPQKRLELQLVESDLKTHQMDIIQLNTDQKKISKALQLLVSVTSLDLIELPKLPINSLNLIDAHSGLTTYNPEIKAIEIELHRVDLESKFLELDAKPNFDVFGRYASESASGTDHFFSLGVGFELPVSNKNRFALQGQLSKKAALESEKNQLVKEKELEWQEAVSELNQSEESLDLYTEKWVSQLESSLDQAIEGFKKGQTDLLSVLELENQWVLASNKRLDVKQDWIKSWCALRQLLGQTTLKGDGSW